ncbi:class I SAM-dependent methyltransferase [Paenibacillus gallinarum]|uniref:class I SAM-dependent methyltransferase n=1 Tax=Paenibacillus gallinarum TaxID=2762232 RepID=UPI00296AD0D2|nr:methyltransferase domain-containing protein [Paenibacillus gallinarum]
MYGYSEGDEERRFIMRIDLGCGNRKLPGCIGIDRFPYDAVDIIHDMNEPLPFEDNSVSYIMASHSLQYVHHLQPVLEEIYRVCKHGAIVCIIAPYAHVTAHMTNPHFKQFFNEHSPRYWTQDPHYYVDQEEYLFRQDTSWSLAEAEQEIRMDFRLLHLEFFYFPIYSAYDPLELSLLRQSQLNVAYQIMYQLVVIKEDISPEGLTYLRQRSWEEPEYVNEQRLSFQNEREIEKIYYTEHLSMLGSQDAESSQSEAKQTTPVEPSSPSSSKPNSISVPNARKPARKPKRIQKNKSVPLLRSKKNPIKKRKTNPKKKPGRSP